MGNDTRTPEEAHQQGFENGYVNGQIGATLGEEPPTDEDLDEALRKPTTANGEEWLRGWHDGAIAGHADARAEGVSHNPELMAEVAESEALARDPQQASLHAYKMGYNDGFMWDTDETEPRGYVELTIQSMPDDHAEGYRLGFIRGYLTANTCVTEAEAQDEYLWRIYGYDEKGNPVTLEERSRRIAEDEAR